MQNSVVPKTTLRFSNVLSLVELTESCLYSQLRFITTKGYKLKSAKGRGTWGRIQESSTGGGYTCPLPVALWTALSSPGSHV